MTNIDIETGKKIKQLRLEKNLSQRALATSCSISHSNLSKIEKGEGHPNMETLIKLSEVLGHGLIGSSMALLHNNEEELILSLFKHVVTYYVPENLDLRSIIRDNPSFYEDTKLLVIDVIKNRLNHYINEKNQPRNKRDISSSKFLYDVGEQPKLTLDDFFK